ncbi:MAG TPA: hypothetical protein DCF49_01585 [Lachnospiraceae bacterium]|nr:hypothetical protein [Lachnospiraceae bacterium]
MKTGTIVLLVILAILIGVLVALYFLGKRLQKQQEEQNERIQANKQPVTLLVIDKKRLKLKESGLPEEVIKQTPWYARRSKVPIVKAKVGPQFYNLIADDKIFDLIPVKKQVKAMVSGIYIVEVKGIRGQKLTADTTVKKSWFRRQMDKLQEKAGAKPVK